MEGQHKWSRSSPCGLLRLFQAGKTHLYSENKKIVTTTPTPNAPSRWPSLPIIRLDIPRVCVKHNCNIAQNLNL